MVAFVIYHVPIISKHNIIIVFVVVAKITFKCIYFFVDSFQAKCQHNLSHPDLFFRSILFTKTSVQIELSPPSVFENVDKIFSEHHA